MSTIDEIIRKAIIEKRILDCDYDGYHRVIEPHVYGIKDGKYSILAYQVEGESSSGQIGWKRMFVEKLQNLKITEDTFDGARPTPTGKHSQFDTRLLIVKL